MSPVEVAEDETSDAPAQAARPKALASRNPAKCGLIGLVDMVNSLLCSTMTMGMSTWFPELGSSWVVAAVTFVGDLDTSSLDV